MDAQASQANPSGEVYQRKLENALGRVTTAEEKVQRLETELGDNESSRSRMEAELEENEQEIGQLQGELATQREQLHKEIELDRFRCVEEERRKWEARESRLVDQLEIVQRSHVVATTTSADAERKLLLSELEAARQEFQKWKVSVKQNSWRLKS